MSSFFVFGYGSLMWNPGFRHLATHRARMTGVHRAPCIYSWVHRGTPERPGIVLGLAPGGSCRGVALEVENVRREEVIAYLRGRELVTNVYRETWRSLVLENGRKVSALTYLADPAHRQFAGRLGHEDLIQAICGAVGRSGPNEDYILSTARHLKELGIRDQLMEGIARELTARGEGPV